MGSEHAQLVDLRRMRTVVEVARAEAITSAARTLGLTQSAVSRAVAEIEAALGQQLFERLPRGIRPTEAGERFVARAKRLLADVDDLIADAGETADRPTGRLRIGVDATGWHATSAFVAFAEQHPQIPIETIVASAQTLYPRLLHGELDLVIGSSSYLKRWRDLDVSTLTRMHFACMVRMNHPLTRRKTVKESEVLGYPLILPQSIEPTYSDIAQRYAHHGLPTLRPHYVTDNFDFALQLLGVTDAFFPMLHPDPDFGGITRAFSMLRNVVQMPEHYVSFASARNRTRSAVVQIFESLLRSTFAVDGPGTAP